MVPLARALVEAGHEVAFATAEEFCARVELAGFTAMPAGLGHVEQMREAQRRFPEAAGLPAGQERFLSFVPRMLAAVAAPARAADMDGIVRRWHPDLVVHGEAELAAPVVAEANDLPYAAHGCGVLRPLEAIRLAGESLEPLCREWEVELGPFGGLFRYLYLDVTPPSLRPAHARDLPVLHAIEASEFDAVAGETLPEWVQGLPDVATIHLTMGTLFNAGHGVFKSVLDGLRDMEVNVVVTIGYDRDIGALGPQPPNVYIEHYIPLSLLLPHCDLVIAQGGWSVIPMLAHGLPLLLLPQGAIQFWHAEACVSVGAARRLLPSEVSAAAVAQEVETLLEDSRYRDRAVQVSQEMKLMPTAREAVRLLEQLERERRPLKA